MKLTLFTLAAVPLACAHTHITNLFVNGVDQGDMVCVRGPSDPAQFTFPVNDLNSPDMACGLGGTTGVSRVCPVPDGATLTFKYHKAPNDPSQGALEQSHKGSCAVYLKKVDNAKYDGAAGDGWFKLWDMGFTDEWCTVKMAQNGGLLTVNLPKGLAGGHYLVRPELLALHQAKDGNPQYYVACAQVYVQSSGDLKPINTVSIPGYSAITDAANIWNIYNGPAPSTYVCPGPPPTALVNGGSGNGNAPMNDGGKPEGCILEVGNWCGFEVPEYHDVTSGWASHDQCFAQKCWENSNQAMQNDCEIWQAKCMNMQNQLKAGNFNGPPEAGKILTPSRATIDAPPPFGPTRAPSANAPTYKQPETYAPVPAPYVAPAPATYEQPAPAPAPPSYEQPAPAPAPYQAPAPAPASYEQPAPAPAPAPYQAPAPEPEPYVVRWKLVCGTTPTGKKGCWKEAAKWRAR